MWVSATARAALRCTQRPSAMVPTMINTHRSYKTISTPNAPSAIGPYSQAVVHNGLAFVSGCIPFDPKTMQCVDGGVEAQAQRALDNLLAVVKAAGSDKSQVLKTTVFLKDMNDFAKVNVRFSRLTPGHLRKGICAVQARTLCRRSRAPASRCARRGRVHRCRSRMTSSWIVTSAVSLQTSASSMRRHTQCCRS